MKHSRLLLLGLPVIAAGLAACSAGSDTSINNSPASTETGDTNIVWTDTLGLVKFDGDSTDWQPRLDYENNNQVGIKPYWPNPTTGKGGFAFRPHKTTYIQVQLDTTILFAQYHSAGLYSWGIPLTGYANGVHHLILKAGPAPDSLRQVSHGEIRKQ